MAEEIPIDGSASGEQNIPLEGHIGRIVASEGTSILDAILNTPAEDLIPWEECQLPSNGLYYGWPDGIIKVKAMGQKAEKVLATARLAASGQSIDYLFRECCKFPNDFDPIDLLLGDRIFILYFLRGITYGNLYEFAVTCQNPDCAVISTHEYDLNELYDTITRAKPELGQEPFKVVLPYLSKVTGQEISVGLRFLRAGDANELLKRRSPKAVHGSKSARKNLMDRKPKLEELDDSLTENLEKTIVHVMGETDRYKIRAFVQKLHASDTATIRAWLKDNTPSIDSTIDISCPDCGMQFNMELPVTETFFRPSNK